MAKMLNEVILEGKEIFEIVDKYLACDAEQPASWNIAYKTLLSFAINDDGHIHYKSPMKTPGGIHIPQMPELIQALALQVMTSSLAGQFRFIELTYTRRMFDAMLFTVTEYEPKDATGRWE